MLNFRALLACILISTQITFPVLAHTNTTVVGRDEVVHPDLGYDGGAGLHTVVKTAWTKLADDMGTRFKTFSAVANSTVMNVRHNFGVQFADLSVYIYTGTAPNLTRVADPVASGWTIAVGSPAKEVINVTVPSSGGPFTGAVYIVHGSAVEKLDDLDDVDVTTSTPQDGQALVYNLATTTWVPGASGDSSLKCQSISTPNLVLKSGYLFLDSGDELQVASDLTVSLSTILGSAPANATAYYLYADLDNIPSATILSNGRQVRVVSAASNFSLQTALPTAVNQTRYVPLCEIKSATTGTAWSGTGSSFVTLATRRAGRPVLNVNPTVYELSKQSIGSVGAQNNTQQAVSASDFSGGTVTFYPLAGNPNDGSTNAINLTAVGTPVYTSEGFYGRTVATFDGVDDNFTSTSNQFRASTFTSGGWFKAKWATGGFLSSLFGNWNSSGNNLSWLVRANPVANSGVAFEFFVSTNGSNSPALTFTAYRWNDDEWHHIVYTASGGSTFAYIDGELVGSAANGTPFANTSSFKIGTSSAGGTFFNGSAQDFFMSNGTALTDAQVNAIYSRRFAGAQYKGGHTLATSSFPSRLQSTDYSFWNLTANGNDGTANARNLTNNGTILFTSPGIFGTAGVAKFTGTSSQYFQSTSTAFNPGSSDFTIGGWVYMLPEPTSVGSLWSIGSTTADRVLNLGLISTGNLRLWATTTAGSYDVFQEVDATQYLQKWSHITYSFTAANSRHSVKINGVEVLGMFRSIRSATSAEFNIGSEWGSQNFFTGRMQELFYVNKVLNDDELRKLRASKLSHNANVLAQNQQWYGQFWKSDNSIYQNELDQGFIVDKTANDIFIDPDLSSEDSFALRAQNQSFATTIIPIKTFTTGKLSASPSFPLAHSLGTIPKDFYILTTGQSESGKDDKRYDLCSADATNINCDVSSLTIDSSHQIEVVASAAPIAVSVPVADATQSGIVSIGTQTIAGDKTLTGSTTIGGTVGSQTHVVQSGGVTSLNIKSVGNSNAEIKFTLTSPVQNWQYGAALTRTDGALEWYDTTGGALRAYMSPNGIMAFNKGNYNALNSGADSNTTLVVGDSRNQIVTPTTARTYTLPTTSILKGDTFQFTNNAAVSSSNLFILINSSAGNLIRTVYPQTTVHVMALQDTPTTAAHWQVAEPAISEWTTFTPTFTNTNNTFAGATGRWRRNGDAIDLQYAVTLSAGTTVSGVIKPVLPMSLTIDTTKQASAEGKIGLFWAYDSSSSVVYWGPVRGGNGYISGMIGPAPGGSSTAVGAEVSNTVPAVSGGWGASDEWYWNVTGLPITGWTATKG